MFSIKVYAKYFGTLGESVDYDEEICTSWDQALKMCKKFIEGLEENETIDIGIEIFDEEGKKFVDIIDFNDFESKVFEYNKVSYGYGRHEFVKEEK